MIAISWRIGNRAVRIAVTYRPSICGSDCFRLSTQENDKNYSVFSMAYDMAEKFGGGWSIEPWIESGW